MLYARAQQWKRRLQSYGLLLNIAKTEYMECSVKTEDGTMRVDVNDLKKLAASYILTQDLLRQAVSSESTWTHQCCMDPMDNNDGHTV